MLYWLVVHRDSFASMAVQRRGSDGDPFFVLRFPLEVVTVRYVMMAWSKVSKSPISFDVILSRTSYIQQSIFLT
jgi:hypothetical protein